MTVFAFSTFNHCDMGKRGLEDLTNIISHQLRALGHHVREPGDRFSREGYNLIVECFADQVFVDPIAIAHAEGCRFLYIATEEPTPKGFNHGVAPGMIDRQTAFATAARYASGILHLVPGDEVTVWYAAHAPAAYAELGYAPTLLYEGEPVTPEFDFGFYGQVTYRRQQILNRLQEAGTVLVLPNIELPAAERDAQMRRVRVVVTIREHDDMGFVSSSRCCTALSLGRPVVAEPHPVCKAWEKVVHFSRSLELFYGDAQAIARNWQRVHQDQLAAFREHFSPQVCLGDPLHKIGIT